MLNEETSVALNPFNIRHSTLNIQHSRMRAALLFLALILFASSLSA
jgi:hypothetical protein